MDTYAGLRDRDYFHIMLNLDAHPDFRPTARTLAERFLAEARQRLASRTLEPELRPFRYTRQAFRDRLDQVYEGLVDDVSQYEAQRSWALRTREDVVEWLRQMAPFNQTDGVWLRKIAPFGPIDEVRSLLFTIYVEELGGGDAALHHGTVYTDLLRSAGIELPDLRSRDYADSPDLLDSAFTLPLFQLVVSEFSHDYFPELLGMTQYLEWSSVELRNMVLLHRHFGLDPHFYELHVAIDNAATGHGAMARTAVELYLERTRVEQGEEVMQERWERIWTGYVAFATTGALGQDMSNRRTPTAAERVTAMITERASRARLNHGSRHLVGHLLNDLFEDPAALMAALVDGGLITPGDSHASPFFNLLTPDGPMYTIFEDDEIETWRRWADSLQVAPTPVDDAFPADPAKRMLRLLDWLRERQRGASGHRESQLAGPDPDADDGSVAESVAWWFDHPGADMLRALASDSRWVTPGDESSSHLLTDLVDGDNAMARALADPVPGSAGATGAALLREWITAGCPLPASPEEPVRPLTLLTPADRVKAHPTGAVHGSGSVH